MALEFPHTWLFRQALRRMASSALRHPQWLRPELPGGASGPFVLHGEEPAFDCTWNSWLLLPDSPRGRVTIRKTTWRRDRVEDQVSGLTLFQPETAPQPLMEVRDAITDSGRWEGLLAEGAALRLPPLAGADTIGLDGTIFFLMSRDGFRSTALEWWCDSPAAWGALFAWAGEMRSRCDAAVAEVSPFLNGDGAPGAHRIAFPAGSWAAEE